MRLYVSRLRGAVRFARIVVREGGRSHRIYGRVVWTAHRTRPDGAIEADFAISFDPRSPAEEEAKDVVFRLAQLNVRP